MNQILLPLILLVGCIPVRGCGLNIKIPTAVAERPAREAARIVCYSAGQVILESKSRVVPVRNEQDIWHFQDYETGNLMQYSGDCLVATGNPSN